MAAKRQEAMSFVGATPSASMSRSAISPAAARFGSTWFTCPKKGLLS